jgi:hypothetical protein
MDITPDDNGELGSLYVDGQYVYLAVVTLVNIKILTSTNNHNVIMFILCVGSILTYLIFYFILNLYPPSELYGIFIDIFIHNNFAFALFFMGVSLVMVDIGLHHAQRGIKFMQELKLKEEERKKKRMLQKDSTAYKRRITQYSCKI